MPQNGGGWLNTEFLADDHEFLLSEGTGGREGVAKKGSSLIPGANNLGEIILPIKPL